MADVNAIIGTVGMLFLLAGFVGNIMKKISSDSVLYNVLNIVGGFALVYYAFVLNSFPFLILEGVWALFAVYNLFLVLTKNSKVF